MNRKTTLLIQLEKNSNHLYFLVGNPMVEPDVSKVALYARLCHKAAQELKEISKKSKEIKK